MGILRINTNARAGYLEKIVSLAGTAGLLTLYSAPMPTNGGDAVGAAVQLGQIALANPLGTVAWDSGSSSHKLTFNASTPDSSTDANGTAAWARITDSGGTYVVDMDVTATGGGGTLTISNTTIYVGGTLSVSSAVIALPIS